MMKAKPQKAVHPNVERERELQRKLAVSLREAELKQKLKNDEEKKKQVELDILESLANEQIDPEILELFKQPLAEQIVQGQIIEVVFEKELDEADLFYRDKTLALLNPTEFDNYKLWEGLPKIFTAEGLNNFRAAALTVEFDRRSTAKFLFWPNVDVYHPELNKLLDALFKYNVNMVKFLVLLKQCLIVDLAPKSFNAAWAKVMRAFNDNKHTKGPKNNPPVPVSILPPPPPPKKFENKEFLGNSTQLKFDVKAVNHHVSMQILAGFISALGIAAVAVAFVGLQASTGGTAGVALATVGAVTILGGLGFFKYSYDKTRQNFQALSSITPQL